jgi:type IV pilus assembly protein PilO
MGAFAKLKWYVQVLIVGAVCGGLLGGVYYFFMAPITVVIADQEKKLGTIQTNLDKSRKLQASLAQFKKESAALEAKLNDLKKILPQDKEADQVLKQAQASAQAAGLRINSGVSKPFVDHEVYTEWPLEMEVVGTYHKFGEFLERIRQLPRIVNIGKLRIQSRASEGEQSLTGSVGVNYEATTFVYREEIMDTAPAAKPVKGKAK